MKNKDIIVLLTSAFVVVVAWIIFSVYHNSVVSTAPKDLTKDTIPITPTFDQSIIDNLDDREDISPIYELATPVQSSSPTPTITVIPQITNSPESTNAASVASEGAQILQ